MHLIFFSFSMLVKERNKVLIVVTKYVKFLSETATVWINVSMLLHQLKQFPQIIFSVYFKLCSIFAAGINVFYNSHIFKTINRIIITSKGRCHFGISRHYSDIRITDLLFQDLENRSCVKKFLPPKFAID